MSISRLPADLPARLRDAGLKVVVVGDWRPRGRPGSFGPVGVLNHHTGARDELGDFEDDLAYARWMFTVGRSDLPAPLVQTSLSLEGTVYLGAGGRSNHAGTAKASGSVAAGDGNTLYVGIEWMLSGTQKIPKAMYEAGAILNAVLLDVLGSSARAVSCHYQTSITGKWDIGDPDGIPFHGQKVMDVDKFRAAVRRVELDDSENEGPDSLRLAVVNIPHKIGADRWEACWDGARRRSAIFGVNESLRGDQRDLYAALAEDTKVGHSGLRQTPNPIFWKKKRFEKVSGEVHQIHGKAAGPLARRFPGFNAERDVNEVVLRQKENDREVAVLNTHWVPNGRKVNPVWRMKMRRKSKKLVRDLVRKHKRAGRPVFVMGDTNLFLPFWMPQDFKWYRARGIDKLGGTLPGKGRAYPAPTDHKHGVKATATLHA